MFANLKNKLIEEVKNSKLQQFAAQAQAAVSSTSSTTPSNSGDSNQDVSTTTTTTNENFFSITEEDTPHSTPQNTVRPLGSLRSQRSMSQNLNNGTSTGAIPRTRKLSNSSMASDISFRLPSYDAPATYHLQSDLESEFGSEFGDEITSSNKLDVITKEKLFESYKNSLERYNKYRCRYTDLLKQYKELERDSAKARAVLMETQEKALRRINELREQCSLEQGAKAHLEQALRIEMDDMKCKLQAYETKLKLLGENPENIKTSSEDNGTESLIDLENDSQSKVIPNGNNSTSNELINSQEVCFSESLSKIAELEKDLKIRDEQLKELNDKNEQLQKQEEENSILLAQTKQAIHTELEAKEREVKNLQEELKQSQSEVQNLMKKESQIAGQLLEIKDLREKLRQSAEAKQEVDAKLIAMEHMYNTLKQQNTSTEKQQQNIDEKLKDNEHKLQDLRQQNAQLNEMLQRYQQNEVSLAEIDNELNRTKNENDNLRSTLRESELKVEALLEQLRESKSISNQDQLEGQNKLDQQSKRIRELEEQVEAETVESTRRLKQIEKLEMEVQNLIEANQEIISKHENEVQMLRDQLNSREKELKSSGNKVAKHKKHHESQQHKIKEQTDELEKLRDELNKHAEHLQALHYEAREREEQTEIEKAQLKSQITSIVHEIGSMEEQMRVVQQSHTELEFEKRQLEIRIENMQRDQNQKLQSIESENSQLSERNCLLQENVERLEKLLAEEEQHIQTAENTIQKLNEKMSQVLDENSHMHNAQELMDHDHRTLQDKCDALEKEKLMAEDARNLLENELECLRVENNESKKNLIFQQQRLEALQTELEEIRNQKEISLGQSKGLETANAELMRLREKLEREESVKRNLVEKNETMEEKHKQMEAEIVKLKTDIDVIEEFKKVNEKEKENLHQELKMVTERLEERNIAFTQLEERYQELEKLKNDNLHSQEEFNQTTQLLTEKNSEIERLRELMSINAKDQFEEQKALKQELSELIELRHPAVEQLEEHKAELMRKIEKLERKLDIANADIEKLHEKNVAFQVEIEQLNGKHHSELQELTDTLRHLQEEHSKLQEQIQSTKDKSHQLNDYEQLKIENEYLTKHVHQLEEQLNVKEQEIISRTQEIDELKEKLKSIQCELYVLKENAVDHENQLKTKQIELENSQETLRSLKSDMEAYQLELTRQSEHASYVTQQNDSIQKELLSTQQILTEANQKLQTTQIELESLKEERSKELLTHHESQLEILKEECDRNRLTIETLNKEVSKLTRVLQEKELLETEIKDLKMHKEQRIQSNELTATPITSAFLSLNSDNTPTGNQPLNESEHLRELNVALQHELEKLKCNSTSEISSLQHQIEDFKKNAKENADRIMELESMRAELQMQQLLSTDIGSGGLLAPEVQHEVDTVQLKKNNAELDAKLKEIMNEVQDVSNRNLFLEQKCENYLILEQSNERLKLQNAKLSRQLDETLVSMQHNEGLNANTEFEYLRNIMFQYLTGTANGNNETLVKVISAVLKFSPQQTQVALEKEHQRRSLLNKIL